jgi:glucose-6-phosphate isomerase, archaeal
MSFMLPSTVDFDLVNGLSQTKAPIQRNLSKMRGIFLDGDALEERVSREGDPLVYEFFDMGVPDSEKDVAYGTSITYPGKVGYEYFMTKGHFHSVIDTAEVYYCLRGHGYMMMETPEGEVEYREFLPGKAVYVPGRWAHRSINVHPSEPLITFFAFPGNAGHDYGTIESKGFRRLMVERDGKPDTIDNPHWKA